MLPLLLLNISLLLLLGLLLMLLVALLLRQWAGGLHLCLSTLVRVGQGMRPLCELKHISLLFSTPSQLHCEKEVNNSVFRFYYPY